MRKGGYRHAGHPDPGTDPRVKRILAGFARSKTDPTGHSGRVGMAQAMTAAGAPVAVVARQGRCWSTERMVLHSTRAQAAGDALPYL